MKKVLLTIIVIIIALFCLILAIPDESPNPEVDGGVSNEGYASETLIEDNTEAETEAAESGGEVAAETEEEVIEDELPEQALEEENLSSDIGFRPEMNGFGFENYGDNIDAENLTPAELQRMFGDVVCAKIKDGNCVLTPPAEQWMEQINEYMSGGHCEGMAVLSLLMYNDYIKESEYGGNEAIELPLENELQREIAYWWTTQTVEPTAASVIQGTPVEILETLLAMEPGGETYTIGIYKPDGSDGHAITPFAVADRGDGLYAVLVYDNNYPGETRELYIDTNNNTWQYEASINPQVESMLYEGNAETMTLELTPTSARLGLQYCPFCGDSEYGRLGKSRGAAMETARHNEIFLEGDGHLLMMDDQERYLGYLDGQFVNEIPGAKMVKTRTGSTLEDNAEPIYWLPRGINATIQLDGSTLSEESPSDLVLVGPGYTFGIEGILLEPEQVDTIYFAPEEGWLTYVTDKSQSPNIIIGVEEPEADFYFEIQGADMMGGGEINVMIDTASGDLIINAEKLTNEGAFNLFLTRIDDEMELELYADDLVLKAGSIVYISYAEWTGEGDGLFVGVDLDGDTEIDETYEVED
ncbi:MAG: hypothetical protein GX491_19565 [Chloroflexi bacterium]|nr:hypothetical protein [Chloroflexota bacterium]